MLLFQGCYVTVYGHARAHWTETRTRTTGSGKNRHTTTYTVHFEGKEVYLNSKTYLFGAHGSEARTIEPGIHRYNFACQLPDRLPYSMSAIHGQIEYCVEAVLDIPWRFDKECKMPFTVARIDDLNFYRDLQVGQKLEEIKTFCCLFCQSGPLLFSVSIPYSGFAGGQKIPIRVEYSNKSDVEVESTRVKLKRSIHFVSHTPETKTRTDTEKMVEKFYPGVSENGSIDMMCEIDVPIILMNSNGNFCNVIRIEYFIEVEGIVGSCHTNPEVRLPITIGSIPINFDTGYSVPMHPEQPQIPQQLELNPYYPAETSFPTAPPSVDPSAPMEFSQFKDDLRKFMSLSRSMINF